MNERATNQRLRAPRCVDSPTDVAVAAQWLATGGIVACAFANFYALVSHPGEDVVRHVNAVKGRPLDQVGSISTTSERIAACFDWSAFSRARGARIRALMDTCFQLGPFGFRGPAADHVPDHLTQLDSGVRTTQVIAAGRTCPSNAFFAAALAAIDRDVLYITSANRSHHATGTAEEPAHWTAAGIAADFLDVAPIVLLAHRDEHAARSRYPSFSLTSVTLASFHTVPPDGDGPLTVTIDRHGSFPVDEMRPIARSVGVDVELGPRAAHRLEPRRYDDAA